MENLDELVIKARTDIKSYELLYHKVNRLLYYCIKSFNFSQEDRDSIVHLSFVKAVKYFKEDGGSKFVTYAPFITLNEAKMLYRQQKNERERMAISYFDYVIETLPNGDDLALKDMVPSKDYVEDTIIEDDTIKNIYSCIDKLDDKDKKIILDTIQGKSQSDIAVDLGICQSRVSKRLKKIRVTLKKHFKRGEIIA